MPISRGRVGSIIIYPRSEDCAATQKNMLEPRVLCWKTSVSMEGHKQDVGQCGWHFGYMCTSAHPHKPSNKLGTICNNLLKVVYFEEGNQVEGETFSLAL